MFVRMVTVLTTYGVSGSELEPVNPHEISTSVPILLPQNPACRFGERCEAPKQGVGWSPRRQRVSEIGLLILSKGNASDNIF